MPYERPAYIANSSVIAPDHPANCHSNDSRTSSYTYRTRNDGTKLKLTLGWELEANHCAARVPAGVQQTGDGSVNGDGMEYVVLPAITRSPRYVLGLLKDLVHAPKLNTDDSCGFHMHLSAANLNISDLRRWAIATEYLAMQVEDAAFKAVPEARQQNQYCRKIQPLKSGTRFSVSKYSNNRRYHWLNTVEMFRPGGIRTIEVRLLGHTHRWKYLLAWTVFCMELVTRGWDVARHPFDGQEHKDFLNSLLERIASEIKPLENKSKPIPQWVYAGLENHGLSANSWDRPLSKLNEAELVTQGLARPFYSDNQINVPNREEEDCCPCGCGEEEGRCETQLHEDSDCDSQYCIYCHEDGNCAGRGSCDHCISAAHQDGEDCGRTWCSACQRTRRVSTPPVSSTLPRVNQPFMYEASIPLNPPPLSSLSNVTIHTSNTPVIHVREVQRAVNELRNMTIDSNTLQTSMYRAMTDATLYGRGIVEMIYDEVPRGDYFPTLPEELNYPMTDAERLSSDARERTYRGDRRAVDMMNLSELSMSIDRQNSLREGQ